MHRSRRCAPEITSILRISLLCGGVPWPHSAVQIKGQRHKMKNNYGTCLGDGVIMTLFKLFYLFYTKQNHLSKIADFLNSTTKQYYANRIKYVPHRLIYPLRSVVTINVARP